LIQVWRSVVCCSLEGLSLFCVHGVVSRRRDSALNTFTNRALTEKRRSRSRPRFALPRHLVGRLYLLAAVLTLDCMLLSCIPHPQFPLRPLAQFGIVSFAVFFALGYSTLKAQQEELPFSRSFFFAHIFCIAAVGLGNLADLHGFIPLLLSHAAHLALSVTLLAGITLLALACIPLRVWIRTISVTHPLWLISLIASAVVWFLRNPIQSLWNPSGLAHISILQTATFDSVQAIVRILLPDVIADPANFTLGTPRFLVFISDQCSGLEGLGLVLVFTLLWLWYFRKESRFPQALLLVPCALACVWLLNIIRITAIILIGDAGAPDVAMIGFHSQAGWISFTAVAFIFSMATRNLSWVRRIPASATRPASDLTDGALNTTSNAFNPDASDLNRFEKASEESAEPAATAAYLVPFLAILAASFVSKAASGYFEWLYPLRFIAAAIALWYFRSEYRKLDWRFGWIAPLTGAAVFLAWIAPSGWMHEHPASSLGAQLAALSPTARFTWIAFRVAAAVITVPIAEELAFRGYLARRLMKRNFDEIPFSSLSILTLCVSSAAFGLMYGKYWMVGILAGLAYAALLKWRGRFGDAIVAHATSNLLLAVWVLARGDWAQW
jgi:CAAX prenyl protease-like protein